MLSVESLPVDQGHAADGTEAHILQLPSTAGWVATGFRVEAGQSVSVIARGTVTVRSRSLLHRDLEVEAGPEGTYLFGDDVLDARFPLPAAGSGPAPCYGIIGRVDDGPVFPVGRHKSWTAKRSGMLWLSLNDDDPTDNSGSFHVQISRVPAEQPVRRETVIPATAAEGRPLPGCSVVVFYMDGLRPDIIHEMAALGHLPHISRLFVEGGTWPAAAFTGFPSDTITSNGTMWTGCFSDRHGLKGQVRFSRRTLRSESYLEPLGPSRSSRVLSPQGFDRLMHNARRGTISMARGHEASEQWSQTHVSEIDPVYAHLRRNGSDWATGVLPLMTDVPPLLWTRSMVRSAPYFQSHEAWQHIDDANAHYAVSHLLPRKSPVTVIWLPETDSVSHKLNRGQFGVTRRTIAQADRLIGRVVRELEATGRLNQTYLMLVSDHGHHGGRSQHLSNFDLASDVFFRPREITPQGQWTGGGLGMSVRQHRQWNRHPEDPASAFVFMDGDSDGAARIFLPRGHFHSGQWQGPTQPATMFRYAVRPDRPPVNLVEQLSRVQAEQQDGSLAHPIDLVLLRLADDQMLISTADRGAAVVTRRRNAVNRWEYRYQVVTSLTPREDGTVDWQPVPQPQVDPLGLLALYPAQLLARFHGELEWLELTAETEYPDSVVALTRHMLWDEELRFRAEEYAPDLVVTARRGWYFGGHGSPGTMHGYPFRDAMQATLFVSGPNIRQGAQLLEYCRLADLTPTILEMAGIPADPEHFDGRALRRLYRTEPDTSTAERPVYWDEVDLAAWHPLRYSPRPVSPLLPVTVNRPDSPLDLNNLAYNLVTVGDINVTRLFDDVLFPLSPVRRPLTTAVDRSEEWVRSRSADWISGTAGVLDLSLLAIADYSPTSLGNIERALSLIDWVQGRGTEAGERAGTLVGRDQIPGQGPINRGVDRAQWGFREGYRTGQRLVMQLLDETLINGLENSTDRAVNRFRQHPAEIIRPASADFALPVPEARVVGPIARKSADQPGSGPTENSEPVGRVTVPGTRNVSEPTGRATVRGTLRTRY
ncbi:MAG: alkaline phosphatase family protein [Planctomycetaceae bacterium]|nr:alkaline phosphatase family protein [Planctomycetaceae bacterium]